MLMLGDQKVNPMYCKCLPCCVDKLYFALASVEIAFATSRSKSLLKLAAIPIACGNTVAFPALATPCKPSFHQLYAGIPRRGTALLLYPNKETFSSSVSCFKR